MYGPQNLSFIYFCEIFTQLLKVYVKRQKNKTKMLED